jgi:hypothetical protein
VFPRACSKALDLRSGLVGRFLLDGEAALLAQGTTEAESLDGFPRLTAEMISVAPGYAAACPLRERHRAQPWRDQPPIRKHCHKLGRAKGDPAMRTLAALTLAATLGFAGHALAAQANAQVIRAYCHTVTRDQTFKWASPDIRCVPDALPPRKRTTP